jgi:hypothetical protein
MLGMLRIDLIPLTVAVLRRRLLARWRPVVSLLAVDVRTVGWWE